MNLRELILGVAKDMGLDFIYYDRKNDEELKENAIENAISSGDVTVEEIAEAFTYYLRESLGER